MKKILLALLILVLCLGAVACGTDNDEEHPTDIQTTDTAEETTEAATQEGDDGIGDGEEEETSSIEDDWENINGNDGNDLANDNNWSDYVDVPQD